MARVFYGSIITDMVGSVGGMSFQHNRSGKIVRQRPIQKKANTIKQSARIQAFHSLQSQWSFLSVPQKTAWNTFAAANDRITNWGETKSVNGYNWYMSINSYLVLCGESILSAPPTWLVPTTPGNFDFNVGAATLEIEFDPSFSHTDYYIFIWLSSVVRSSNTGNRKLYRLIHIESPGSSTVIDLESAWEIFYNISFPPAGYGDYCGLLCAVQTVHKSRGLASPFVLTYDNF